MVTTKKNESLPLPQRAFYTYQERLGVRVTILRGVPNSWSNNNNLHIGSLFQSLTVENEFLGLIVLSYSVLKSFADTLFLLKDF